MTPAPRLDAPVLVMAHALAATLALAPGPVAPCRRRDRLRARGAATAGTALTALALPSTLLPRPRPFGPILGLALRPPRGPVPAIRAILARDAPWHAATMRALFRQAPGAALPGRRPDGIPVPGTAAAALLPVVFRRPRRARGAVA